MKILLLLISLVAPDLVADTLPTATQSFQEGIQEYRAANFSEAAREFRESVGRHPTAGASLDLGNAEWQQGRVGPAILAWEQTLWLSPTDAQARNNLKYARSTAQIEAPELAWYEVISTWTPSAWWAMLTALCLWTLATLVAVPGIFRHRRTSRNQALAAIALTLLLLSLPAHYGWYTRSKIGIVLDQNTPLRLTPTELAQEVTRVGAGDPGRCERMLGNYCYVRFRTASGWIARDEFALIAQP